MTAFVVSLAAFVVGPTAGRLLACRDRGKVDREQLCQESWTQIGGCMTGFEPEHLCSPPLTGWSTTKPDTVNSLHSPQMATEITSIKSIHSVPLSYSHIPDICASFPPPYIHVLTLDKSNPSTASLNTSNLSLHLSVPVPVLHRFRNIPRVMPSHRRIQIQLRRNDRHLDVHNLRPEHARLTPQWVRQ